MLFRRDDPCESAAFVGFGAQARARARPSWVSARRPTREPSLRGFRRAGPRERARETFVAERDGRLVGTYFLRANYAGGGAHVANCGYITAPGATGSGVARAMCAHSLAHARARGFRAMQFNCVVSTNTRAVRLWTELGFAIVGTLPGAFAHPALGDVDAYVMYQRLTEPARG